MQKLIDNIKKYFLKFVIVGGLNTAIHMIVYNIVLIGFGVVFSNAVAFIIASIFSYYMNVNFTYQQQANSKTFTWAMITFAVKFGLNAILAYVFEQVLITFNFESLNPIIPIFITAVLLPIQFIVFNVIFGVNKEEELVNES